MLAKNIIIEANTELLIGRVNSMLSNIRESMFKMRYWVIAWMVATFKINKFYFKIVKICMHVSFRTCKIGLFFLNLHHWLARIFK